jgi:glyoxylase-like metal-dependent hydrolase (beta-lactamase superfamily II)
MGLETLDLILITHIHIDHAGGLARVLESFPRAKVICHRKGIKHLVDPERLWAGSLKTLGEVAEAYGPLSPVKEESFIAHDEARINRLHVIETPGHAPHHLSFAYEGNLFVGEAGGTCFSVQGHCYMRPATPPRFFPELFLQSIDKLLNLDDLPIFFGHLDQAESSHTMLNRHRAQLIRWGEMILRGFRNGIENVDVFCDLLIREDPDLSHYHLLPPEHRERERFFLSNSIRGYLDHFKEDLSFPGIK